MAGESILFSLGTDNRALTTGLNAAKQQVSNFKGEVAGVLTGIFATVGVEQLISDFARVQDIADQLGITAEEVQRVRGAADTAGTGIEFVAKQMTKATLEARKLADGIEGIEVAGSDAGKAAEGFRKLGIDAKTFAELPLDQQILAIAQGMDGIPEEGDKIAAAIDLFGAKGKEMIPLLIQGHQSLQEEFERTAVVSNEMVAQIAAADDELARMSNTVKVGAVGIFVFVDKLVKSIGALFGGVAAGASVFADQFGITMGRLKAGDFSGAASAALKAYDESARAAYRGFADTMSQTWSPPEIEADETKRRVEVDTEQTSAVEKRLTLEERLNAIREESDRKQLETAQQILELKNKQAEAEDASRATGLDPKEKQRFEDAAVDAAKQVAALEEKQRADEKAANDRAIAEKKKADDEAKAKAERVLGLRQQLHQQELSRMTKEEKNAALLKDLQELAGRNVKDEEDKLKLQLEAGEIADRLTNENKVARVEGPNDLVTRLGGTLGGIYNGPMNLEAQKQTSIQQEIVKHVSAIASKEFTATIPEAD